MRKTITIVILTLLALDVSGQNRDSLIASLNVVDWPINMLKGHTRITVDFEQQFSLSGFDLDGNKFSTSEQGTAQSGSIVELKVEHGITSFLQAHVRSRYYRLIQRNEPVITQSFVTPQLVAVSEETIGFSDLNLGFDFKWPFDLRKYDLRVSAGVWLPVGKYGNKQPLHSRSGSQVFQLEEIIYRNLSNPGDGVASLELGGAAKFRFGSFAITGRYDGYFPLGESTNQLWMYTYENDQFVYSSREFTYKPSPVIDSQIDFEYLVSPYFSLSAGVSYWVRSGGWDRKYVKTVAHAWQDQTDLVLGYNLIVSQRVWLIQRFSLPVRGYSQITPFGIRTLLMFNNYLP